jgi:hypothetical protein
MTFESIWKYDFTLNIKAIIKSNEEQNRYYTAWIHNNSPHILQEKAEQF